MAKRFTDTEKWKKLWFRKLSPGLKLFWLYLCDNCDHAGIWDADIELASFQIGQEVDEKNILDDFDSHIRVLKRGKWFIQDFVDFQYGTLNKDNRAHLSVINRLKKYGANKPLKCTLQGDKDMVKDKDKDMDMVKDKELCQLQKTINDFINMRKKIKKPITDSGIRIMLAKLEALSDGVDDKKIKILENSIMNSWMGIFELKDNTSVNKYGHKTTYLDGVEGEM